MKKLLRRSLSGWCWLLLFVGSSVSVFAQSPAPESPSPPPVAKDARTRAKIHTELGAMYFQDGNIPIAMEELTVAIYIDPDYAPAYSIRALVHNYLKEQIHAEDNFKQAVKLAPDDPEIANNYGWFLCQIGREAEGMPMFMRAISNRLYQTPDKAYLNAGQCALKMGNLALAADFVDKGYRLSGGSPVAAFRLAEVRYRQGMYEEAKRLMADMIRVVEPSAEMLWLAVRIERKLGDRNAEAQHASQLGRRFSQSPEYQELLKGNYE